MEMNNRIGPMDKHVWNVAMCMVSRIFSIPIPQQLTTWANTVVHFLIPTIDRYYMASCIGQVVVKSAARTDRIIFLFQCELSSTNIVNRNDQRKKITKQTIKLTASHPARVSSKMLDFLAADAFSATPTAQSEQNLRIAFNDFGPTSIRVKIFSIWSMLELPGNKGLPTSISPDKIFTQIFGVKRCRF